MIRALSVLGHSNVHPRIGQGHDDRDRLSSCVGVFWCCVGEGREGDDGVGGVQRVVRRVLAAAAGTSLNWRVRLLRPSDRFMRLG